MSRRDQYGSTASPSPLPHHIRPSTSRTPSSSSANSSRHPHAQQREFVPSTDAGLASEPGPSGLGERWVFEHAEHPHHHHHHHRTDDEDDGESDGEGSEDGSEADWKAAKETADARVPKWRRASPRWLYPFVTGATLALGMGIAPRSEIYVNLACLAHPPRTPSYLGLGGVGAASGPGGETDRGGRWEGLKMYSFHSLYTDQQALESALATYAPIDNSTGTSDPISVPSPNPSYPDLSPADKWFLKVQRDIYDYETLKRTRSRSGGNAGESSSKPSTTLPSPTDRPGRGRQGGEGEGDHPDGPGSGAGAGPEHKPDLPPYREIDPKACKRDPGVQAAAAKLVMTMTLALGILSALTTGYWGQMSDKIGRTRIMAILMTGLLLNEICFTLVATFPHLAPGGYRALLIGPTLEGLLGGIATLTATLNAYVSDVTPDGSRASVFARMGGIFMLGFACGPVLGSFVIKATGNIMTPFYLNICVLAFYVFFILLILPESLSKEARSILSKTAKIASDEQRRKDTLAREWENETPSLDPTGEEREDPFLSGSSPVTPSRPSAGDSGWSRRFSMSATPSKRQKRMTGVAKRGLRKSTAFIRPLAIFMPKVKEDGGRDWNMTVTGAALFTMSLMMGVYQVKAQYTLYTFGWTSAQLGPYMSLLGFSRGFVMLVLLPVAMRLAKPYFVAAPSPSPSADPSSSTFSAISGLSSSTVRPNSQPTESSPLFSTSTPATPNPKSKPTLPTKARRPATLDLWTARLSLGWEAAMYLVLALNLPEFPFIAISALVTLSAASNPAVNSLALSFIPNSREAGKLFGGVAVLHALGSTLIGPLAFGTLFSVTVGKFAPAVWVLAGLVQAVSLGFMCFVRIPKEKEEGGEDGRGRVRRSKSGTGLRK